MGILQARILEWVAMPSSRRSSQPSDRTQVPSIVGVFFTIWATREAQEYWSRWLIPSPGDPPDWGIEAGPPALQVDYVKAPVFSSVITDAGKKIQIFSFNFSSAPKTKQESNKKFINIWLSTFYVIKLSYRNMPWDALRYLQRYLLCHLSSYKTGQI